MDDDRVDKKIARAKAEVEAGRSWRAKEMLGGCIGTLHYGLSPLLLTAYGELLDQLGDRYEAGKYLFLSGSMALEHQEAIDVYLYRNRNASAGELVSKFPAPIRHMGLGNLPDGVKSVLESRGVSHAELQRTEPRKEDEHLATAKATAMTVMAVVLLLASVLFWIVGLFACLRWAWSLLFTATG